MERKALADILEFAKAIRDLCDTDGDRRRWEKVVQLAYDGLGKPSMAEIDKLRGK